VELERVVRALHPHIGARVALADGALLGVHRAALAVPGSGRNLRADAHRTPDPAEASAAPPALGVTARDGHLLLVCKSGALELLEVQPAGGRPMEASAFLRGHREPLDRASPDRPRVDG
jgi:methionyl-tRNA formyltransferase